MGTACQGGETTLKIKVLLEDIMYGIVEHEWAEVVDEIHSRN